MVGLSDKDLGLVDMLPRDLKIQSGVQTISRGHRILRLFPRITLGALAEKCLLRAHVLLELVGTLFPASDPLKKYLSELFCVGLTRLVPFALNRPIQVPYQYAKKCSFSNLVLVL